jgi:hypothetical protein
MSDGSRLLVLAASARDVAMRARRIAEFLGHAQRREHLLQCAEGLEQEAERLEAEAGPIEAPPPETFAAPPTPYTRPGL